MRWLPLAVFMATASLAAAQTAANDPALLLADQVYVENDNRLIATGNVEALHNGQRLTASRIVYDKASDSVSVEGPVRITDETGNVLIADAAELDTGFENGLLRGARMVLDEQLQFAAVEARRVGGRYTSMSKVAVTSCQICGPNDVPLWQLRAARVIHDQQERQIYFDQAQLRVLDVPVFYMPRLRLPDPTLKRARGFLIPEFRSSTLLGFGVRAPYFIPIGDHTDLTLTPYISPVTRTLEARMRRAFANGDIEINAALSQDTLVRDTARGRLFADGAFDLPHDFKLRFSIETVSDPSYLSDYNYSDQDRLESNLTVEKVRRDGILTAQAYHFESLRTNEDNATQPTIVGDVRMEKRFFPKILGGEFRTALTAHGHYRYSDLDIDSADADTIIDGRDVARLNASFTYLNRWTLPAGIRAGITATVWADRFRIRQDSTMASDVSQLTSATSLELRWPWVKTTAGGARVIVEPIMQTGWVSGMRHALPNDESTRVEFDEGNLLSLSRFPSADRRERGAVSAMGLRWRRDDPGGWSAGLTIGRIWRDAADASFTASSGLTGTMSDWLIAGQFSNQWGLSLTARGLMNDSLNVGKAEARAGLSRGRYDLGATYVLLPADAAEGRTRSLSEWNFDGSYDLNRYWTATANWRYDLSSDDLAKTSLRLDYRNECVEVGFSVSRRYASSTNVEPSTDFGLTVSLKGFSTGGSAKDFRRTCS
ncbi:LPS assembly protein LptD [Mesobacterium sp. TK19101]|uniref:LPS-assembly protein LptD n=1 Tax=Mesobacterium hydrothermale TaxID=3111907 RepID=A0ABU6HEA3_9RHOB|nr:LPS assembly protein LptD [Mesobacterium sp. TK19101]MEC3860636.1 LPS assembly protein LptD [Mesobacterium sp. TK19101]